jgi:hypothetical protein
LPWGWGCGCDYLRAVHCCCCVPAVCRRGWMGDAHMSSREASFNLDMQAFYSAFLQVRVYTLYVHCVCSSCVLRVPVVA